MTKTEKKNIQKLRESLEESINKNKIRVNLKNSSKYPNLDGSLLAVSKKHQHKYHTKK